MLQHIFSDISTNNPNKSKSRLIHNSGLNRNAIEWENQASRFNRIKMLTSKYLRREAEPIFYLPREAPQTKPNQGWFLILQSLQRGRGAGGSIQTELLASDQRAGWMAHQEFSNLLFSLQRGREVQVEVPKQSRWAFCLWSKSREDE